MFHDVHAAVYGPVRADESVGLYGDPRTRAGNPDLTRRVEVLEAEVRELKKHQATSRAFKASVEEVARAVSMLQREYELEDSGAIVQHFLGRPAFIELVLDAAKEISSRFDSARATLRCEAGDLVIAIPTKLSPTVAEERYSDFLRQWWMPRAGIEDATTLTLDYV